MFLKPADIWARSRAAFSAGHVQRAKLWKGLNYFLFKCLLPYEAEVGKGLVLEHYALGVVMHPNVRIGNDVRIYHGVTLAGESWIGSGRNIEIGDGAVIGVGAIIVPRTNRGLRIGRNAVVGA